MMPLRPPLQLVPKADDPPIPPPLMSTIRKWHQGKRFNSKTGGDQVIVPWVGLECIDVDINQTFYGKTDVCGTSDDDDVAQDIWEHLLAWVKGKNDGLTHNIMVRVLFSDPEGYAGEDFWTWPIALGPQSAQGGLAHAASANSRNLPHFRREEDQVLEYGRLALTAMREAMSSLTQNRAMDQARLQAFYDREDQMRAREQQMIRDARQFELDQFRSKLMMAVASKLVDRVGALGPYAGIVLGRFVQRRYGPAKTDREELAYETFRRVCEKLRDFGGIKTEEDFEKQLKAFGIDGELKNSVVRIAREYVMDEKQEEIEKAIIQDAGDILTSKKKLDPLEVPLPVDPFATAKKEGTP